MYSFPQEMQETIKRISGNKIVLKIDLKILILHFLLRSAADWEFKRLGKEYRLLIALEPFGLHYWFCGVLTKLRFINLTINK